MWVLSAARIVGVSFPFWASIVQAGAERDALAVQKRLRELEDPISSLHVDVREVAERIYESIQDSDESRVQFDDATIARFSRVLAILEAAGMIGATHAIGGRHIAGFWVSSPAFMMYMCALYEDPDLMERFLDRVDKSPAGTALRGAELANEYALPLPVIKAVFQLYEAQNLGLLSKESGAVNYRVLA